MNNSLKILSWNVNGIRAVLKKGFTDFLETAKPDILCLQETKISADAQAKENISFSGYRMAWNPASRPGYSGTALLIRDSLTGVRTEVQTGFGEVEFDDEGRIQVLDAGKFFLVNTYFPNANHELSRLGYKLRFNNYLLDNLKKLEDRKPVVVCGDFNVAHKEIDLARPKENVGNAGFTYEEREWMDGFIDAGFRDTFREFNGDKVQYSWWSYRAGARRKNVGWRIDYFCVSASFLKNVKDAYILGDVMGSDHCPVGIDLKV